MNKNMYRVSTTISYDILAKNEDQALKTYFDWVIDDDSDLEPDIELLTDDETMSNKEFIEEVYELAFGDNAINREFSREEVLKELRRFSDEALQAEEAIGLLSEQYESIETFEKHKKEFLESL